MLFVNPPEKEIKFVKNQIIRLCASDYGRKAVSSLTFFQDKCSLQKEIDKIKKVKTLLEDYKHLESIPISFIDDILMKIEKVVFLTEDEAGKIYTTLKAIEFYIKSFLELKIIGNIFDDKIRYNLLFETLELMGRFFSQNGYIKNNATKELKEILDTKESIKEKIHKVIDNIFLHKRKILQDDFFVFRDGRYVLPVKASFKKDFGGIVRDTSQSGDTLFMEPFEITNLNDELIILKKMEDREKNRILKLITEELKNYYRDLLKILEIYGLWDSYIARIKYMEKFKLTFPEISDNGIYLKDAIHPLLFDKNPVPNDIIINGNNNVLLITGPNGGGKTVALKTLAYVYAATYMAIPVSVTNGSRIRFFERFYFDILDIQDIEHGISSFTAKMILWKEILEKADHVTLVIIDEMGSFTNPQEGSAISCAFLSKLMDKKATIVAGTHLDQIKEFLLNKKNSSIASLLWDDRLLRPTYRIVYGTYSISYAVDVLKSLGFSKDFIDECLAFLGSDFVNFKKMIENYKAKLMEIVKKDKEITELKSQLTTVLRERIEYFKYIKNRFLKMEREYEEKIKELLTKYENFLENVKEKPKEVRDLKESMLIEKNEISNIIRNILPKEKRHFDIGDVVYLKELNKQGKIINIGEKKVYILVDGKKLSFDKNMVYESSNEEKIMNINNNSYLSFSVEESRIDSIDLRGQKVDEAISLLEKFIDNAYISGIDKIKIIHGSGKGRLKEFIHNYLKTDKRIKKFYLGDIRERGGSYYTEVEF